MRFDASELLSELGDMKARANDPAPALQGAAELVQRAYAAADVPRRTGRLRNSLTGGGEGTVEVTGAGVRVTSTVPYAPYVDLPDVTDRLDEPFGQLIDRHLEGDR